MRILLVPENDPRENDPRENDPRENDPAENSEAVDRRGWGRIAERGRKGSPRCHRRVKGHPLFAHVTLTRSERSAIAALVTEMLEDVALTAG